MVNNTDREGHYPDKITVMLQEVFITTLYLPTNYKIDSRNLIRDSNISKNKTKNIKGKL